MFTETLIPKNGTWITETYFPRGFLVADYDTDGMANNRKWFESREAAITEIRQNRTHQ